MTPTRIQNARRIRRTRCAALRTDGKVVEQWAPATARPKPSTRSVSEVALRASGAARADVALCHPVASLTFLGAAQTVTGSRHLLTTSSGKRILIDAGLFQGRRDLRDRNWAEWTHGKLDAVVLTHAHIDHTGFLPRLFAHGFADRILCTKGTRDLAALLLPDSGHL